MIDWLAMIVAIVASTISGSEQEGRAQPVEDVVRGSARHRGPKRPGPHNSRRGSGRTTVDQVSSSDPRAESPMSATGASAPYR